MSSVDGYDPGSCVTIERVSLLASIVLGLGALGYFLAISPSTGGDFGVSLLRQRAWTATTVALATGLGSFVVGYVLYGQRLTMQYVELLGRGGIGTQFFETPGPSDANMQIVSLARPIRWLFRISARKRISWPRSRSVVSVSHCCT